MSVGFVFLFNSLMAHAGEPLLALGSQLTYQVTRAGRGNPQNAGPSEYTSVCSLSPVANGPASFQVMGLNCDQDWACGAIRSNHWLAYTDGGLRVFKSEPNANTSAASGTILHAQVLQSGDPINVGGQSAFEQCQTQTLAGPGSRGRPGGKAGPAGQPREIRVCSGFEVGYTSITGPFCSVTLTNINATATTPVAEAPEPATEDAPAPATEDAPAPAAPTGNPSMEWVVNADGSDAKILYGSSLQELNPLDPMAMNDVFCWASSTPAFQGVRVNIAHTDFPENSTFITQLMGSTKLIEDIDGYMMCDDSQMRLLGGGEVQVSGSGTISIDVRTDSAMPTWPCSIEISGQVMHGQADMVEQILEAETLSSWISCPE